jgi:copper chaperone CopZ
MNVSEKSAQVVNVAAIGAAITSTPSIMRRRLLPRGRNQERDYCQAGDRKMSDAMRAIVWTTGVAFGVIAPGAFAQSAAAGGAMQTNPVFLRLDSNHDGFVSRGEAAQNASVRAAFDQADMNKDGRLDEDELMKALSIKQRESLAMIANEGRSAAKQYAADSEITAKVKAALFQVEGLQSLEVSVQTNKGRVQLAGFVDSTEQIAQSGTIAANESGVNAVLNDLTVK